MSLILLNLQSNQQIKLNTDTPLIIGRGNVEGCFDKRVSRNHGRITCTHDGKVRLAALHCNPCFYTRNGVPPVLQLKKDEEETLNEGDYLGLLPNAFWFKVTSDKETEIKNQPGYTAKKYDVTDDKTDEIIVLENCNSSPSHKKTLINKKSECTFSDKFKNDSSNSLPLSLLKSKSNSVNTSKGFGTPEFEKTRRLPLWMYEIDDPIGSNKSPKKHLLGDAGEIKEKKQKVLPETGIKNEFEIQSTDEILVEDEGINLEAPSTSKIKNDETSNPACKPELQKEARKNDIEKEGYESGVDDEKDLSLTRPVCQYEDNCYRKNPQHKLDFCHPGDADYVPHKERPICQYGAACYRRNEKHKIEFRHPPSGSSSQNVSSSSPSFGSRASPLSAKRIRKNVNKQNYDYEDDDEFDLEEPFINDASSDEYIPSDLESVEEEDNLDTSREDDY